MPKAMKARRWPARPRPLTVKLLDRMEVSLMMRLTHTEVDGVIDALFDVACAELKKNGNFKLAGMLNLKLKKKPATPAKKGINPFTKELSVFNAKPSTSSV